MTNDNTTFEVWYSKLIDLVEIEKPGQLDIVEYSIAITDYEMGMTPAASCALFVNQKK